MRNLDLVLVSKIASKDFKFYDRLVWTSLLRNKGQRAKVSRLSRYMGISRETIAAARDNLVSLGLVKIEKRRMVAVLPEEKWDWFYHLNKNPIWYRDLLYLKVPMPSMESPLDLRGLAVLGFLRFRAKKTNQASKLTYYYVSVNIGIDYRTVASVLMKLDKHGFIQHKRNPAREWFNVPIIDLNACPDWFIEKTASETDKSETIGVVITPHSDIIVSQVENDPMILKMDPRNENDGNPKRCEINTDVRRHPDSDRRMLERALNDKYGRSTFTDVNWNLLLAGRDKSPYFPSVGEFLNLIEKCQTSKDLVAATIRNIDNRRDAMFR